MLEAFSIICSWPGALIVLCGTLIAMMASFTPGVSSASIAAVALALTSDWQVQEVAILFGAITGGATFMGSITAILYGIPGSASSAVALLDGHPLALAGYPKRAIAAAATASALGSWIGGGVLLGALAVLPEVIAAVGPAELVFVLLMGLMSIVFLPSNAPFMNFSAMTLGLAMSLVGADLATAAPRFTLGFIELYDGVSVVAAMLGLFTLTEIIAARPYPAKTGGGGVRRDDDSTLSGVVAVLRHWVSVIRGSVIGTTVGMVPGLGGPVAGFFSYSVASKIAGQDSQFGHGDIRGVIAPEAAIDAKDGGTLVPTIALGIPGSDSCIILLAALSLHGVVPGVSMLSDELPVTLLLIGALLISNTLTSAVGLSLTPLLAKVSAFSLRGLAPYAVAIAALALIGMSGSDQLLFQLALFTALGLLCKTFELPRIPIVVGLILGPLLEKNLLLTTQLVAVNKITWQDLQWGALGLSLMLILAALRQRGNLTSIFRNLKRADVSGLILLAALAGALSLGLVLALGLSTAFERAVAVAAGYVSARACLHYGAQGIGAAWRAGRRLSPISARAMMLMLSLPAGSQLVGVSVALPAVLYLWLPFKGDPSRGAMALARLLPAALSLLLIFSLPSLTYGR